MNPIEIDRHHLGVMSLVAQVCQAYASTHLEENFDQLYEGLSDQLVDSIQHYLLQYGYGSFIRIRPGQHPVTLQKGLDIKVKALPLHATPA